MILRNSEVTEGVSGEAVRRAQGELSDEGFILRSVVAKPALRRWLLMAAGITATGLGIIGVFVPLLPTTPFLLLAAACFIRSSDRLYAWLIHHRWFGSYIRNYRDHRAITPGVRAVSLILLWVAIGYSVVVVATAWWLRALLGLILVGVTLHLLSLRTLTREMGTNVEPATTGESPAERCGCRLGRRTSRPSA